jgi:glucose-1-phosphate adenylyltransferase
MFVLTQYNSASLNRHIKNTYHFSAFSSAFVDILAAEQTPDNPTWYQGTADAVRQSLRHIGPFDSELVLILSGDQLYQMDFQEMIDNHKALGADITVATIPVNAKDASDFGIMKKDDAGYITSFTEKPKQDMLVDWVSDTGPEMQSTGRVYLASIGTHKVVSYQYDGYWTDIGNIHSFFEANIGLTDEIPDFNLFDNSKSIYTRARMLPPGKISGTTLEKTMIAEGCIINASRIENSVIGIRSRIGYGTTIVSCYVMGNDYFETLAQISSALERGVPNIGIGHRCYIKNAIVDKNCRIGNDVRINGGSHLDSTDHPLYTVKDGIVVIKKGAVLPNGFVI